jgi:hypothetical protein
VGESSKRAPVWIVSRDPSRGAAVNRTALHPSVLSYCSAASLSFGGVGAEMPANAEVAASSEPLVGTATIQQVVDAAQPGDKVVLPAPRRCATNALLSTPCAHSSPHPSHL